MNYHIFKPNSFFNSYIEDVYTLHCESNNTFWVRGDEVDNKYLHTKRPITYIGSDREKIVDLLKDIKPSDKLFISWYDIFIGKCILDAGVRCPVYCYLMGGEFYNDPDIYHDKWLFDRETLHTIQKLKYPQVNYLRRPSKWNKIIHEIKDVLVFKKKVRIEYKEKVQTINRIDFIITTPENQSELSLIKKLYPSFHAQYIYGVFDQNVDLICNIPVSSQQQTGPPYKILLGNSADPTNNHLDGYKLLKKGIHDAFEIFSPLSYGYDEYSQIYINRMSEMIGEKFHPITTFADIHTYIEFLKTMDIVVMNHNRQQAYGNIIMSLMLGKPVFMKPQNAAYKTFKSMGIQSIYDIYTINNDIIHMATNKALEEIQNTRKILYYYFSNEKRLQYLRNML